MPEPIPFKKPEGAFYSFSMEFDEAESVAEAIWEALPLPATKVPS